MKLTSNQAPDRLQYSQTLYPLSFPASFFFISDYLSFVVCLILDFRCWFVHVSCPLLYLHACLWFTLLHHAPFETPSKSTTLEFIRDLSRAQIGEKYGPWVPLLELYIFVSDVWIEEKKNLLFSSFFLFYLYIFIVCIIDQFVLYFILWQMVKTSSGFESYWEVQ